MSERTSRVTLTGIFLLLALAVFRLFLMPVPVSAQSATVVNPYPPQMVVSNNTVYIFQNGKISVYGWDVKGGLGGAFTQSLGNVQFRKQAEIDTKQP